VKFHFIAMGLLAGLTFQGFQLSQLCYAAKKRAPEIYSATEPEDGSEPAAPLNMPGNGQVDSDSEKTAQTQAADGADAQPAPALKKAKSKIKTKSQNFKATRKIMTQPDVNRSLRQIETDLKEIKTELRNSQNMASPELVGKVKTATYTYDPVPSEQANAIAKRLQIVEILLRKYGRAYDYRIHTYKDLKKVLAELDRNSAATSAPPVVAPGMPESDIATPPEVPSAD
jgi:hypothetical protein